MKKQKQMLCIAVVMLVVALANLALWLVPYADIFRNVLNPVFSLLLCGYMFLNIRKE